MAWRVILICLSLAACATPREACLSAAGRDLAQVDKLILETEGNLSRGYAIAREPYTVSTLTVCLGKSRNEGNANIALRYCNTPETRFRNVPVAIDPAAERRKLALLKDRRRTYVRTTEAAQTDCRARFPES